MSDPFQQRYTPDEVSAIVRRALSPGGSHGGETVSYEELAETAREMGVSAESLHAAIRAEQEERRVDEARETVRLRRRQEFFQHVRAYCIVNGALFLINVFTTGLSPMWVVFPLIGWGIGLAFHASSVYYPDPRCIDSAARRIIRQENRRAGVDRLLGKSRARSCG